ncbi:ATP-binding cassette domain-containing protein [Candidatus Parcubacteria bacterium]|nr:ATP-binding cassette domain-containing protein [Candidatus Parcubacteria bacterium]
MNTFKRTDEILLDIRNISLSFGSKLILRDVNATIKDLDDIGQVVCFLGPSGIGKTQLSRIIAGLQTPSAGEVRLRDKLTKAGEVCMVPQNYVMFDYATVAENLVIAGKQAGLSKPQINEKATGFIKAFELEEHLGKYPKELSGGTKQRVAIARQLMCASNYMVMDEPFSGLDPIMKKRATEAIVKLSQLDTYNTIIVVTHDITEGLSVADTVWLMGYEPEGGAEGDQKPTFKPGARLIEQYDLADMGFAWHPDIAHNLAFLDFVGMIKDRFQTLR